MKVMLIKITTDSRQVAQLAKLSFEELLGLFLVSAFSANH